MSLTRAKNGLAVVLFLLAGTMASGQGLRDMQLFAPADADQFGGGPRPNEGFFFGFDVVTWYVAPPEVTTIGFQGLTREVFYTATTQSTIQSNTLDTGEFKNRPTEGERYEFGYISGHHGYLMSLTRLSAKNQRIVADGVDMVFQDSPFGPTGQKHLFGAVADYDAFPLGEYIPYPFPLRDLPLTFEDVSVRSKVETWSVELEYLGRLHPLGHGGILEWFIGARYMEFDDKFYVDARGERFLLDAPLTGNPIAPLSILGDSFWNTEVDNRIVGPQVGGRWFRQSGRWIFSVEGRFFAGFNSQHMYQHGMLGSKLNEPFPGTVTPPQAGLPVVVPYVPIAMTTTTFNHNRYNDEWAPAGELRADVGIQLTRAITFKAGWTGFWMDGLARAANVIDYSLSESSIFGFNNSTRTDLFAHGFNFGVTVNR